MIDMENLVRQMMTEQAEDLHLGPDAATRALTAARRRRHGHQRLALVAGSGVAFAIAGTGIAAATGTIPWWRSHAVDETPFATASDPSTVAGSNVRLTLPGPESTTLEVVTNTVTTGTTQVNCTAVTVKGTQGGSQHLTNSCGTPGMAAPTGGSFDWQAPSGTTYAILTGPNPTSTAAKVVLKDNNGVAGPTEPVGDGYYLTYAPAAQLSPTDSLVFYDASGQIVYQLTLELAPLVPCAQSGDVAPCG